MLYPQTIVIVTRACNPNAAMQIARAANKPPASPRLDQQVARRRVLRVIGRCATITARLRLEWRAILAVVIFTLGARA